MGFAVVAVADGLTIFVAGVAAFEALVLVAVSLQSLKRGRGRNSAARKTTRQACRDARSAERKQREAARIAAVEAKIAAEFAAADARRQKARVKPLSTERAEAAEAILREQLGRADNQLASLKQALADKELAFAASQEMIGRLNSEVERMAALVEEQAARFQSMRAQSGSTSRDDTHFRRLRALIIRELHPDHAAPDSIDRALRSEVFKAIWPKIEAIAAEA